MPAGPLPSASRRVPAPARCLGRGADPVARVLGGGARVARSTLLVRGARGRDGGGERGGGVRDGARGDALDRPRRAVGAVVALGDLRADAGAEAGHDDRRDGGQLGPARGGVVGQQRQLARPGVAGAAAAAAQQQREREQRGDLLHRALAQRPAGDQRLVDAGGERLAAARLAVGDVARQAARVARAETAARGGRDDRLDPQAALAGGELVVLLREPAAGAEERALDGGAAHAHPLADLAIGEALELAQDEDLVMGLGEPAERADHVVELLLGGERGVRHRLGRDQAAVVGRGEALVGVEGDLLRALGPAELVDARVLGDLVDPRLERDRALRRAHAAQRGHEDLLRDVLGALMVLDHAVDVRVDAAVVALVERLEGTVVPTPDARDERVVARGATWFCGAFWRLQERTHLPLPTSEIPPALPR